MTNRFVPFRRVGFTLIELLVVIVIIAILVALLIPAVQASRESARRAQCASQFKNVGMAFHSHNGAHNQFPAGFVTDANRGESGDSYSPAVGWGALLLPWLEQGPLFNTINFDQALQFPVNFTVRTAKLSLFHCPSEPMTGAVRFDGTGWVIGTDDVTPGQYVASSGWFDRFHVADEADGVFYRNSRTTTRDIPDGLSQTLFASERARNLADGTWIGAIFIPVGRLCTEKGRTGKLCASCAMLVLGWPEISNRTVHGPDGFSSRHPGGILALFGDGSVSFVKETVEPRIFESLTTRNGREVVSKDQF
ncbi:MAG: DUF1559 domain-containing protein [Isosphaeraceae bacterium]